MEESHCISLGMWIIEEPHDPRRKTVGRPIQDGLRCALIWEFRMCRGNWRPYPDGQAHGQAMQNILVLVILGELG